MCMRSGNALHKWVSLFQGSQLPKSPKIKMQGLIVWRDAILYLSLRGGVMKPAKGSALVTKRTHEWGPERWLRGKKK